MTVEIRPIGLQSEAAIALGLSAGLEDAEGDTEGLQARWGAFEGPGLVGTVALRHWRGMWVLAWMVVAEARRGRGLGSQLLRHVEAEAVARGARRLWVTARKPGFYRRAGYVPVVEGAAREALLAPCSGCDQYGLTCHPVAAVKELPQGGAGKDASGGPTLGRGAGGRR